jgi:hypothetical protein
MKSDDFHPGDKFVFHFTPNFSEETFFNDSFSFEGKENEDSLLSQDGKRPMNEGRDEQSDSSFAMKGHGDPEPAQP